MKLEELKKLGNGLAVLAQERDSQKVQEFLNAHGLEMGNVYQELEMTSRFVDTHRDVSFSNTAVSLHSHAFYEILYCCNDCGAEYLVGAERYRLRKGDIILVPPDVSHRPLLPGNMAVPYKRYVLWISVECARMIQRLFPDERMRHLSGSRLLRTAGTKWESLGALFRRGVEETERKSPGWEILVMANSMELMVQIQRAVMERSASHIQAEKPELLDQIMAYVETHLAEKITLEEITKHFWVSQSTITQTFRNKMGVSFYRCVTQRRLIAAKTLILEGLALENVGQQVGFSDYSSFYRAFKQEYGISPRQYRKLQDVEEVI